MELNPKSPFSGKPLSECDDCELDAWCAKLCGHEVYVWLPPDERAGMPVPDDWPRYGSSWAAAGPLMERDEWPQEFVLCSYCRGYFSDDFPSGIWHVGINVDSEWERITRWCSSPTAAIRNAFIIAATHAKEQQR